MTYHATKDSQTAAVDVLDSKLGKANEFAASLVNQYRAKGYLSPKQWAWVERLIHQADSNNGENGRRSPASLGAEPGEFLSVVAMFDGAADKLKNPRIDLAFDGPDGTEPLALIRAGERSKSPGTIAITDGGPFESNTYYGRIDRSGSLLPSSKAVPAVVEMLRKVASDPANAAAAYGQRSGRCCFCRQKLSDGRSLDVGYGPVCAGNYGLPWGGNAPMPEEPFRWEDKQEVFPPKGTNITKAWLCPLLIPTATDEEIRESAERQELPASVTLQERGGNYILITEGN